MSRILLFLLGALPLAGHGAEAPALPPSPVGGGLAGSLGQMAFGLVVVVAALFACLWLLKRLGAPRGAARGLRVLGAAPVGQRERVVLVEVADKVLVLGVAPGRVNTLHTLAAGELAALQASGAPAAPQGFADRLKTLMEARRND